MITDSDRKIQEALNNLSSEEKLLLEDHFVKERNKKNFVKFMKGAFATGAVIGTFTALVLFGKNVGEGFSK